MTVFGGWRRTGAPRAERRRGRRRTRPPGSVPAGAGIEAGALVAARLEAFVRAADAALADSSTGPVGALADAGLALEAALAVAGEGLDGAAQRRLRRVARPVATAASACREVDLAIDELVRVAAGLLQDERAGVESLTAELRRRRARRAERLRVRLPAAALEAAAPPATGAVGDPGADTAPGADAAPAQHVAVAVRAALGRLLDARPSAHAGPAAIRPAETAARRLVATLEQAAAWHAGLHATAGRAERLAAGLAELRRGDELRLLAASHRARLREQDAALVRAGVPADARDVLPGSVVGAPNRRLHRGLEALDTYLCVRRRTLARAVAAEWEEARSGTLEQAVLRALS